MVPMRYVAYGIVSLFLQVGCKEDNKYDNYTLVRLIPEHEYQVLAAVTFLDPSEKVEVLKNCRGLNDSLDLLVPPDRITYVQDYAQDNDLVFEIKKNLYGRHLESDLDRAPRRRVLSGYNVYGYNSFSSIQDYIAKVAQRHPDIVTLQTMGNSYQGRRMKLVKISADPDACNPIILIDAGIHAREWVAPAMALYIIHRLTNDAKRSELNGVDWYIIPVVNPDGYEYTRSSTANRMWRKTRSKSNSPCLGVDGNRNYGFKWAVSGVSKNPCNQETYAGPQPFSEPETQMVRNVMAANAKRLKLYVSLHSYGQYLVYPWGYTGDFLPKEWQKLDSLANMVSDAVARAGGQRFKVMSAGKWYPAAGGSDDYAFGAIGVPYSYTMELTNGYEFVFPEHLLRTVMPQFYEGFKEFGKQIRNEFKIKRVRLVKDASSSSDFDTD